VPSDGGRFEVFVGNQQIYSKLDTGRFPEEREIIAAVHQQLG